MKKILLILMFLFSTVAAFSQILFTVEDISAIEKQTFRGVGQSILCLENTSIYVVTETPSGAANGSTIIQILGTTKFAEVETNIDGLKGEFVAFTDTVAFSGFRNWEALINDTLFLLNANGDLYSYKVEDKSLRILDTIPNTSSTPSSGNRIISAFNGFLYTQYNATGGNYIYKMNSEGEYLDSLLIGSGNSSLLHRFDRGKGIFSEGSNGDAQILIVDTDLFQVVDTINSSFGLIETGVETHFMVSDRYFVSYNENIYESTFLPVVFDKETYEPLDTFSRSYDGWGAYEDTLYVRLLDTIFLYDVPSASFVDTILGVGNNSGPGGPTLYVTGNYIYANDKDNGFSVFDRSSKKLIYRSDLSTIIPQNARRIIWSETGIIATNNRSNARYNILKIPTIKNPRVDADFINAEYMNTEIINVERANVESARIGEFNSEGTVKHGEYGQGNKEATDLSKIESAYVAAYATDGTLIEKEIGENKGLVSDTTDGNGDITIPHNLDTDGIVVTATATGTTFYNTQVHSKTTSNFKIRFFDSDGNPVTATAVEVDWVAKKL